MIPSGFVISASVKSSVSSTCLIAQVTIEGIDL
jgi:hypothetical protein